VFLGLQSRDAVRLGQAQGRLIEEQTRAAREQAAIAREELEEMRRRDRPVLPWDQGEMQPQFMWNPWEGGDRTQAIDPYIERESMPNQRGCPTAPRRTFAANAA